MSLKRNRLGTAKGAFVNANKSTFVTYRNDQILNQDISTHTLVENIETLLIRLGVDPSKVRSQSETSVTYGFKANNNTVIMTVYSVFEDGKPKLYILYECGCLYINKMEEMKYLGLMAQRSTLFKLPIRVTSCDTDNQNEKLLLLQFRSPIEFVAAGLTEQVINYFVNFDATELLKDELEYH